MLINWFTVIAQIINFLILVFLLWRFLYKPILQTIRKRQAMIDRRWEDAEVAQEKAEQEAIAYRQQQQELQQQKQAMMTQARQEVEQERQQLVSQARHEVEQMQVEWKDSLAQDKDDFLLALRQRVIGETNTIVRHALRDLANADLEGQIVAMFCQRLQQMDESQRQAITQSLSKNNQPIIICSSFEMPLTSRLNVTETLHSVLLDAGYVSQNDNNKQSDDSFKFTTSPDLICGIQVKLAGYEIAWNLDDYLHILEERLSTAIK